MTKLQDFLNSPVTDVTGMRRDAKRGDVFGLELECEGRNVDYDGTVDIAKDWAPHNDGSLRAHHGSCCEWVFNGPVKYEKCVERIDKLFAYFAKRQAKLVCSNRTSFHVHFNMGDKNVYQLINLFILFTIFEDILDAYCGDDRRGNLFCLSSRHAEQQVRWVEDACFRQFNFGNFREDWRYCSLNMAAINKFGTVEFRAMRGLDSREDCLAWLSILNEFCDYACYKMKNPVDIIEGISRKTPKGFLREVFTKENYDRLTANLDDGVIEQSIYEGLRLVQMLCYRIGTEFDKVRLRGRDFWASFGGDPEPVLDVAPEDVGAPAPRGRGFGGIPVGNARARMAPPQGAMGAFLGNNADPLAMMRHEEEIRQALAQMGQPQQARPMKIAKPRRVEVMDEVMIAPLPGWDEDEGAQF